MVRNIKKMNINFLLRTGFLHIFSSQILNVVLQFATSVVLIRILSKDDFGSWQYALNILSFFLLLQGLGVVSGILQYSSSANNEEERQAFFKYGLKIGLFFNFIVCLSILIYTIWFDLPVKGSTQILRYLCLVPLFSLTFDILQIYFRASFKNQKFSRLSTLNSIVLFIGAVIGGELLALDGLVLGRYFAYIICIILGIVYLGKECKKIIEVGQLELSQRREFLKYSIVSAFNNSISSVVYLLDTFMIGLIIKDQLIVASYKTATLIPFGLNFIPMSIMIYAYPYFAKMSSEKDSLKYYVYRIQKYLILLNGVISLILIVFAPQIIQIMFGSDYSDSVTAFRILSIGYFIAGTFRIPAGNVLASIKKIRINFVLTLISGVTNVILNIILIPHFSSLGAAVATVSVFILSSIIANGYLFFYFKRPNLGVR
ncbi:oligosaccharide flippase family protein [Paenibacillus doosanensis]|uniref:oligosaccharide flippase family protein n=1 Tax=Paenibacillus doosanensis TaxID=1229154 RepID=UPI00217F83EB|nr:oligosaccharide flippase family protein [Paenibacillus doosanensis]MCS7459889.1 oligosaccharide flippase family protein [Paenibacillus doosanensis]